MRLHTEVSGEGIAGRRSSAVRVLIRERGGLLAVQVNHIGVARHLDLATVPVPYLEVGPSLVCLLAGLRAHLDVIDRPGPMLVEAIRPCALIDLHLEAR